MGPELATLDLGWRGTLRVGRLEGEVDLSNADALHERIVAGLEGSEGLILDLGDVTYMDSAGLVMLSRVQVACRRSRIPMAVVVREGSRTERTIELAGLELVGMTRARSVEDAERSFGGRGGA
jgi:anti-anti-sigma factor